ncbi:MAG: phosphoglucosamine mutase [Clostridia bacterium]|nr:phosphoglucosamine mutase [Clostridia bacterium]
MGAYFGTDGFRGRANVTITARHAFCIGQYLGKYYVQKKGEARILIGKDTRVSSYMLESAMTAGITSSGADAYLLHVTTTPSVSYLVRTDGFDCGVMISASHNPYYDNGIKLFNGEGEKADDALIFGVEENLLRSDFSGFGSEVGKIVDWIAGRNRYIAYLLAISSRSFRGYKVGLDCSNGSAWMIAKCVFDALGAQTECIGVSPNGKNINETCGATDVRRLCKLVQDRGLDVGFAFDGDADRCICVDEKGNVVDGDGILFACALALKERGELGENAVVATQMSNYGLTLSLQRKGIACVSSQVGDRYVYEEMLSRGLLLGGEQSGHVIFRKYARTGDGLVTAIKMMEILTEKKCPASLLTEGLCRLPQVQKSVYVSNKMRILQDERFLSAQFCAEKEIGSGRVFIRPSGTEEKIRILVEGEDEFTCRAIADRIENVVLKIEEGN